MRRHIRISSFAPKGRINMKTTIVTTTINIPVALLQYVKNARSYGHRDLDLIVIGDRKSPPETADFCKTVADYYPCAYWNIEAQRDYLGAFRSSGSTCGSIASSGGTSGC